MLISSRRAGTLAAALLTLTPLLAQEPPAQPDPAVSPAAPVVSHKTELVPPSGGFDVSIFDGKPVQRITLHEAIERALANNLEVRFERMGLASARAQVRL